MLCYISKHNLVSSISLRFATLGCGALLFYTSPLAAHAGDTSWAVHNRVFSINLGTLRQNYTEDDPFGLTNDGTLDTEHGSLSNVELGARWQGELIPLLLQATASRSNGGTHYNGYLQSGNQLLPYSGTTGNLMLDFAVRVGWPIGKAERWQWVPFIEFQQNRWQRQLAQYSENFNYTAGLVGLQVQWWQRADSEEAQGPWSFEIEGAAGQLLAANMDAPSFGFDQPLGKRSLWQIGATLGYDLTPRWRISATASTLHFSYGQAASQGGVVEPSNHTQQPKFSIGLGWHY